MTTVSKESFNFSPLAMAIFEYYCWKKSVSKTAFIRGLLTAYPRLDPEFDFDEFEWFVNKVVKPALKKKHPDAVAELLEDAKRFRERPHTSHTTMFFDTNPPLRESSSSSSSTDEEFATIAEKLTKSASRTRVRKRPSTDSASLATKVSGWGKPKKK